MKKSKQILIVIILILIVLAPYSYKNHLIYLIPYNPLEIIENNPLSLDVTIYKDKEYLEIESEDLIKNQIIFNYFKDLKLIPLKTRTPEKKIFSNARDTNFDYRFTLYPPKSPKYYYLSIDEIWIDNLSVLRIRSDKPNFRNGYYKIIDSKFDYIYINNLIKASQE